MRFRVRKDTRLECVDKEYAGPQDQLRRSLHALEQSEIQSA